MRVSHSSLGLKAFVAVGGTLRDLFDSEAHRIKPAGDALKEFLRREAHRMSVVLDEGYTTLVSPCWTSSRMHSVLTVLARILLQNTEVLPVLKAEAIKALQQHPIHLAAFVAIIVMLLVGASCSLYIDTFLMTLAEPGFPFQRLEGLVRAGQGVDERARDDGALLPGHDCDLLCTVDQFHRSFVCPTSS